MKMEKSMKISEDLKRHLNGLYAIQKVKETKNKFYDKKLSDLISSEEKEIIKKLKEEKLQKLFRVKTRIIAINENPKKYEEENNGKNL